MRDIFKLEERERKRKLIELFKHNFGIRCYLTPLQLDTMSVE